MCLQVNIALREEGDVKITAIAWRFCLYCGLVKLRACRGTASGDREKMTVKSQCAGIPFGIYARLDAFLEETFGLLPGALTESEFGLRLEYKGFETSIISCLCLVHGLL